MLITWEQVIKLLLAGYGFIFVVVALIISILGTENKFIKETIEAVRSVKEESFANRIGLFFLWGTVATFISSILLVIWINFRAVAEQFLVLACLLMGLCFVGLFLFDLIEAIGSRRKK